MTRHVHFSSTNQLYSPDSKLPSLSWSPSSLPSSVGPHTPPSRPHMPLSPLPPVAINPVLGLNMDARGYRAPPLLSWHLTQASEAIVYSGTSKPLRGHTLDEPATEPALRQMTLMHPQLPWPIVIQPSRGHFVTVEDVVHTLYRQLRLAVSSLEYKSHPCQDRVGVAFQSRCGRIKSSRGYEEERSKGVKRVDFLLERPRWVGLSSTKKGPDVWMLNTCPW